MKANKYAMAKQSVNSPVIICLYNIFPLLWYFIFPMTMVVNEGMRFHYLIICICICRDMYDEDNYPITNDTNWLINMIYEVSYIL